MAYFDCQIVQGGGGIILTVQCNSVFAGAAITATDGVTTLSQTCPSSSPYEVQFNIPNVGTWTISGTYAGDSYSTQVVIPSSATLSPIPNGSTATPTAVIQTWLHCADIWDKNYTTINQVLADSTTLLALISSNNAVDYMARSTSWASSVCANSTAMTYIGANNYCADALLANSTWLNAICNSTYFESVLNVKVPTMTSNTTPSGVAGVSSDNSYYETRAYICFSGQSAPVPATSFNSYLTDTILYYKFTSAMKIKKFVIHDNSGASYSINNNYSLIGSNDNITWNTIQSFNESVTTKRTHNINNNANYLYYGLKVSTGASGGYLTTVQFYGRKDV